MTASGQPELSPEARAALAPIVELLARDETAPTTVRDPESSWKVHVADSLSGLAVAELAAAQSICDIGAGAGFPGLVLAAALPAAHVDLVEATGRKCEFITRAAETGSLANARAVNARAEDWAGGEGREAYDVVTARALGRLSTLAELASPLLPEGGVLVAWKGRRDQEEESELDRASEQLAMTPTLILPVGPYAGSENRHLHVVRKSGPTPDGLPRRAGMAKKRPRGAR